MRSQYIECMQQVLEHNPTAAPGWFNHYYQGLATMHRTEEAEELANWWLDHSPANPLR